MQKKFRFWVLSLMILLISFLPGKSGLALPSAEIVIHTPGSESRVTSPIDISASITPGADDLVRVSLIDQRGNLLARKLIRLDPEQITSSQLATQLAFEIPTAGAEALLILATKDTYNRPLSLGSILLSLNVENKVILENPLSEEPWLIITTPEPSSTHRGGVLQVSGKITPISYEPIIFELITDSGGVIGSKALAVDIIGEELAFDLTMIYGFINTTRDTRLVIRQFIAPFDLTVALDSIPIFLEP